MKPRGLIVVLGVALAAAVSCSDNSPVGATGGAGTGGGAGTSGAAGSFGAAGTSGVAGTFGVAGTSGVAGVGGPSTGISGTTGAAGTPSTGCRAFGGPTLASGKCVAGAFKRNGVCECQSSAPAVCGDRCVDVMTDDANCGCCGNACGPTSTCNNGKCGPAPVTFRALSPGCGQIELDVASGGIAWTERARGLVTLATTGGGAELPVAVGEDDPHAPAVVGGTVYWLTRDKLRRGDVTTKPTTVISAAGPINGFVVAPDGFTIYYSTGTEILRTAINAPPSAVVVAREEHGGIPRALAIDGSRVMYPTELNGDVDVATVAVGKVASCSKEGPNGEPINVDCLRVARSQGSLLLDKIVALPGRVLWADGFALKTSDTTGVNAPANDVVGMTDANDITGFAANPMVAYFSERTEPQSPTGVIYRAVIGGNQISTRIARGQIAPRVGAIDQSRVYWSTAACAIMATGL